MDTSLIINALNGNKKVTKAISNINPEKDNETLETFALMVNDLSTNSYVDATRVDKQSVKEQGGSSTGTGKIEGVITVEYDTVHYNGDGTLYFLKPDKTVETIQDGYNFNPSGGLEYYFFATATDNFTAAVYIINTTSPQPDDPTEPVSGPPQTPV